MDFSFKAFFLIRRNFRYFLRKESGLSRSGCPDSVFVMESTLQRSVKLSAIASKLRSRSGHTLVELLTVLLLISFFGLIALLIVNYSVSSTKRIVDRSRAQSVSDTINETLRGILRYSTYIRTDDETVCFLCESYSGWEISLEADEGFIFMCFHDGSDSRGKILTDASYAGFSAEDFTLTFENGVFSAKYRLVKDGYSEDVELSVRQIQPLADTSSIITAQRMDAAGVLISAEL